MEYAVPVAQVMVHVSSNSVVLKPPQSGIQLVVQAEHQVVSLHFLASHQIQGILSNFFTCTFDTFGEFPKFPSDLLADMDTCLIVSAGPHYKSAWKDLCLPRAIPLMAAPGAAAELVLELYRLCLLGSGERRTSRDRLRLSELQLNFKTILYPLAKKIQGHALH
eukprot:747574-Hanusia_phi.AAC.19